MSKEPEGDQNSRGGLTELVGVGFKHSVAQAFLIFSGILVLFSLSKESKFIFVSFFTLFYALIAHYLTSLRRHESLGQYAVGANKYQIILFTLTYIAFFVWWATGVWSLLSDSSSARDCLAAKVSFNMACVSGGALIAGSLFMSVWILGFFCRLPKAKGCTYRVRRCCTNCGYQNDNVEITTGVPSETYPCPKCGVATLH